MEMDLINVTRLNVSIKQAYNTEIYFPDLIINTSQNSKARLLDRMRSFTIQSHAYETNSYPMNFRRNSLNPLR
jgi:hypothetical protein